MENEPRDLQLLDDDEEGLPEPNNSTNYSTHIKNHTNNNSSSIKGQNVAKFTAPQAPINVVNSAYPTNGQTMTLGRPTSFNRFKISPNNPNLNDAKRQELKSIARPRSRSSSRFNSPMNQKSGIEEYIQMHANENKTRLVGIFFCCELKMNRTTRSLPICGPPILQIVGKNSANQNADRTTKNSHLRLFFSSSAIANT